MQPCSRYEGAGVNDATRLQLFGIWFSLSLRCLRLAGRPSLGLAHGVLQKTITTIMKGDESGEMVAINGYDSYGIANETNIGRFLQTDPIGYEDQVNLYAYVGNDPVNLVDPTGMYECSGDKNCKGAATAVNQITQARDVYRSVSNNRNLSGEVRRNAGKAADALDGVLVDVGTENDGNGLTIEVADLPGRTGGDYKASTRTIRLDTDYASRSAEPLELGAVLGHEVQHDRQRTEGLGHRDEEVRPYIMQYMIGSAKIGQYKGYTSWLPYTQAHVLASCPLPSLCAGLTADAISRQRKRPF